jgi:hypothetical protein
MDEVAPKEVSLQVSLVFPLPNIILPLLHTHATARRAINLITQHIITSSVYMFGASSLIQLWAGYEVRKSVLIYS